MVLNIRHPDGLAAAKRLAERADVLVQNFRPGTLERLGLGYEDALKLNPGLVYCNISGFGGTGPYSRRGGFDLVAQGMSGLMSITGAPGSDPVKVGVPVTDLNAGMYSAYGILSAYIGRLRTGRGQLVDTSLLEAGLAYTFWESAIYFATGETPTPLGSAHRMSAPYQAFRTADGHVNIGAANQANWERLCVAIDRRDLLADARFASNADRMANLGALVETLQGTFETRESAHWLEALEREGVPAGPINDMAQVYADPQVQARDMVVEMEHPAAGRNPQHRHPGQAVGDAGVGAPSAAHAGAAHRRGAGGAGLRGGGSGRDEGERRGGVGGAIDPLVGVYSPQSLSRLHSFQDFLSRLHLRHAQFESLLEVLPQLRRRAEVARQAQGRVGCYSALAVQDSSDAIGRDIQRLS